MGKFINGLISGRVGNKVYRVMDGKQIVQSRPEHYHDAGTTEQVHQRTRMRKVVEAYQVLKPATCGCWQRTKDGCSDYNLFVKANIRHENLLDDSWHEFCVSDGTLDATHHVITPDGLVHVELDSHDCDLGNSLRLIAVTSRTDGSPRVFFRDHTPAPRQTFWDTPLPEATIAYAVVRVRRKGNRTLASPEKLKTCSRSLSEPLQTSLSKPLPTSPFQGEE